MRLIDADALKKEFKKMESYHSLKLPYDVVIDNAPTVEPFERIGTICNENCGFYRPQGEWFDCIEKGTLKARHGDYVLYKVDFLLDNLTREVYIMEGARRMTRRMRGKEE